MASGRVPKTKHTAGLLLSTIQLPEKFPSLSYSKLAENRGLALCYRLTAAGASLLKDAMKVSNSPLIIMVAVTTANFLFKLSAKLLPQFPQ